MAHQADSTRTVSGSAIGYRPNPSKRAHSKQTDEANLARALDVIGCRPVGSVTRADVQALVDTWKTTLAPSTVARTYSTLRAVFSYA